jgi:hypothetical protein
VSYLGYYVIRKEGVYFKESQESFNRISKALKLNEQCWKLEKNSEKKYELFKDFRECSDKFDFEKCNKPYEELLSIKSLNDRDWTIRDCFQLLFVLFSIFFLLLFLVSVVCIAQLISNNVCVLPT